MSVPLLLVCTVSILKLHFPYHIRCQCSDHSFLANHWAYTQIPVFLFDIIRGHAHVAENNILFIEHNSSSECQRTWSSLRDQKANMDITAWPESQRGHQCRTRKPMWLSLQDQKVNVVIIAGPGSQPGHHCRTRKPTWSSLQDQKTNVVITTGLER